MNPIGFWYIPTHRGIGTLFLSEFTGILSTYLVPMLGTRYIIPMSTPLMSTHTLLFWPKPSSHNIPHHVFWKLQQFCLLDFSSFKNTKFHPILIKHRNGYYMVYLIVPTWVYLTINVLVYLPGGRCVMRCKIIIRPI